MMSTEWNCDTCNLPNSHPNEQCQACFTSMSMDSLYTMDYIQTEESQRELETDCEVFSNQNQMNNNDIPLQYATPNVSTSTTNNSALPSTTLLGATNTTNNTFDSKSTVNPKIISKLMNKQRILFDGFLRFASNFDIMFIPSDIITLSFQFFVSNISKICKTLHEKRASLYSIQIRLDSDTINTNENDTLTYNDLYELAMILRSEKDCFMAYELMKELLNTQPNLSEYHNAMGLILKRWSCFDLAEMHYQKAIDFEPNENIYKWNYGLLLEERMKFDLALTQFLNASKNMNGKEPDFIFEAAYCYQKLNEYNNATVNYLKAIEMNRNKSTYWIYYGEFLSELKQFNDSIKCFEKAIELDNENINYYYRFARHLRDFHENYELSKFYYEKCLEMNKQKDSNGKLMEIKGVNGSVGYLLLLMGEYEESNKYFLLAQITDPNNVWSYFYFGLLQFSYFNNKKKAYALLCKAIKCCNAKNSIQKHLDRIKIINKSNIEYHNAFQSLLNEKFDG